MKIALTSLTSLGLPLALACLTGCLASPEAPASFEKASAAVLAGEDTTVAASPKAAFAANRAKWNNHKSETYAYRIHRDCLCFPYGWAEVQVENGAVTRLDSVAGKDVYFEPGQEKVAPTLDDLFAIVAGHIGNPDFKVEAAYDAELGYPTRIKITYVGASELFDADIFTEAEGLQIR